MSEESDGIAGALRQHRLFRIATVYALAGWIAIQVADIILEAFESPVWIMQGFLILVLAGFPATLTGLWLVDRTRQGRTSKSLVSIATIALASLISFAAYQYFTSGESERDAALIAAPQARESDQVVEVLPDDRPAIAVLPFNNLSPDPDHAFFADGLAEDLITRLSSWRAFPVIARNSSFQYRGGEVDLKRVSRELGVRYVVEGSVRRAGERIRVNAQLIDATSGKHVWAETYDRKIVDVFSLQDEISALIAASLVGDLTRAEGERAHQRGTNNIEAWSLYQLGLQHFDRYTLEGFAEAREMFRRAAEIDPRFATPQGQLAIAGLSELMLGRVPNEEFKAALMSSARRAVELDPRDPVAHLGLGGAYIAAGDIKNGLASSQKAVDLNPSMPMAWIWLGWSSLLAGDPGTTVTATERARTLNPQGAMVWVHDSLAAAYWELGRYDEALEAAQRLVATQPTYLTGYAYIAMSEVALGRLDEARTAIIEGRRVQPDLSLDLVQNYFGVSRPTIDARRNAALRTAGLD
jgi:adenylate cyclase